jgi:hypothetical protein
VGGIPKSTPTKELVPDDKSTVPITRSKASGVNKVSKGDDKAARGGGSTKIETSMAFKIALHLWRNVVGYHTYRTCLCISYSSMLPQL